ncbi:MAG TPA: cell envelope biogenesis protein OmpA [Lachnospiraceae bacterium]|nr:cell envelope biogenesis protein OmpA [Lachnospiraceae bacterium]
MNDEGSHNIWRSYSDMMSGLLLLFVLIMAVCLMQAQKNYNDRLAEQASRVKTQEELQLTQEELQLRESEVEAQSLTLTDLQAALENQAIALSTKESELDSAQQTLSEAQQTLTDAQKKLEEQQILVADQQTLLAQQESELEVRDQALLTSQQRLDEQTQLMSEQQRKIDQIIGVKADLIDSLNKEFAENQINVNIDEQTGAIVLDSNVLFALREWELTEEGAMILTQVLPVYCEVLLSEKYVDYVAEIIIDGYTDSQGDYLSNLELSQNRAFAVASYLLMISDTFLDPNSASVLKDKLTANGRSESNLVLDENGVEDRAASRRVEVKFRLKDDEMIQELSNILSNTGQGETTP